MVNSSKGDPDGRLFDDVYAQLRGKDPSVVPWANARPHPMLASWLEEQSARGACWAGLRTLVIGVGLGDDANVLAALGCEVTAFDYSPHAIAWARERFPDAPIDWHVADLFALPEQWRGLFELVVEVHTIQALPVTRRQSTIRAIVETVAPGGALIVVAMTRDVRQPLRGRPWPLTELELQSIGQDGLSESGRLTVPPTAPGQPGRIRVVYHRGT